jgi:heterodisulfide reductase subunit A
VAPVGKILVIGGGIGGIQCALDLAETGFYVYLLEKSHTLGGTMAQLDKTFPTNDCSTCMFSPKMVQVARSPNVEIIAPGRLQELTGAPGRFQAKIEKRPRFVDPEKCITCGQCAVKCPKKVADPFNAALGKRKAAFLTFPQAVPLKYALDADHCLYLTKGRCGLCQQICPTDAIVFDQQPEMVNLSVGAVIVASGFELALTADAGEFGFGRYRNVVSSIQFERMLSATGPWEGHIRRPSDDQVPRRVAWIQCVMSRDAARNRPFCSSVCCMHATKQAVLTRTHEPQTEAVIYFMDIRAHGKGFDEYVERARSREGVKYRRSMISQVYLNPLNENLIIETFDHHQHRKIEEEYDLVVLSSGFKPSADWRELMRQLQITPNAFGFATADVDTPVSTSQPGVFVCGGLETPKDIPETVIQAGAAAAEASVLVSAARNAAVIRRTHPIERDLAAAPRVGVFVCHCGSNIAGVVDIPQVLAQVETMPQVVFATDFMFSCSGETLERIVALVHEHQLNRVVVAACSPKTHEPLFQEALRQAGVNPYLFELANIRNQCSWVHAAHPEKATPKAVALIRASVARALHLTPLHADTYRVAKDALVVGGGMAGMTAALSMADQGFHVHLVEKGTQLGGFALNLTETLEGASPGKLAYRLADRIRRHPKVNLFLGAQVIDHKGHIGAFEGIIRQKTGEHAIDYGAVVVATGGQSYTPQEHLYARDERVVTQVELAQKLAAEPGWARQLQRVVMIQCVGSRNTEFAYCSRVCCSAAVKNSITLKRLNPEVQVIVLYRDLRTFGFKELYYLEARRQGALFFRFIPEAPPQVDRAGEHLVVDFTDRSSHQEFRIEPDLVALSAGIRPHEGALQAAQLFKLPRTPEGFFLEAHVKLKPVEFTGAGIFLAGLAHSPRFVDETITMAKCAAQQAVKILCQEEMTTAVEVAEVDQNQCASCLVCVRVCPFNAPYINADGVSEIPAAKCRGCGICVAECPARAIQLKHTTDDQICAAIDGILLPEG